MNADAFRYVYEYHFCENRRMWESYIIPLSFEKFVQPVDYSHGSVRDQVIHLMDVDEIWFCELRGVQPLDPISPADQDNRENIRAHWVRVEQGMRDYLTGLQENMLFDRPIKEPEEDKNLIVWQVLLHVINHGTDHRAQILRLLHDMGVKTSSQDLIFHIYDHLK